MTNDTYCPDIAFENSDQVKTVNKYNWYSKRCAERFWQRAMGCRKCDYGRMLVTDLIIAGVI